MSHDVWEDLNGRVACYEHVGAQAQSMIDRRGGATFTTDLTTWFRMDDNDKRDLRALFDEHNIKGPLCEDCRDREERHARI